MPSTTSKMCFIGQAGGGAKPENCMIHDKSSRVKQQRLLPTLGEQRVSNPLIGCKYGWCNSLSLLHGVWPVPLDWIIDDPGACCTLAAGGLSRGACPPRGGLLTARVFGHVKRQGTATAMAPDPFALLLSVGRL